MHPAAILASGLAAKGSCPQQPANPRHDRPGHSRHIRLRRPQPAPVPAHGAGARITSIARVPALPAPMPASPLPSGSAPAPAPALGLAPLQPRPLPLSPCRPRRRYWTRAGNASSRCSRLRVRASGRLPAAAGKARRAGTNRLPETGPGRQLDSQCIPVEQARHPSVPSGQSGQQSFSFARLVEPSRRDELRSKQRACLSRAAKMAAECGGIARGWPFGHSSQPQRSDLARQPIIFSSRVLSSPCCLLVRRERRAPNASESRARPARHDLVRPAGVTSKCR